jgi:two-component system osmolarity sensor histidine kinase EnvZ
MKLQLELMDKSPDVKEMSRDVSSMEHMISSYLDFARGEGGEESGSVYAQKWLREAVNELSPKDLKIQFGKMNQKVLISIKPQTFKRAIANILSNSAKYGTVVLISVYKKNNDIMIEFEDNGPGIQDEEKSLVLKAFYRSDKSRNDGDRSGSVGLGLAITREIIRGHNGYISLHDGQNLGGLLVRISLPSGKRN